MINIKRRHFYNEKDYFIDEENKVVRLSPELHSQLLNKKLWGKLGFKKVGGSSFGNITGSNNFGSKFQATVNMMFLPGIPFDDKYVAAGNMAEPQVVAAMDKSSGIKHKVYDAGEWNYDYFKDNENFGGLPDAYNESTKTVYELKTTGAKNKAKWEQWGVPMYYQEQVALYDYLMHGETPHPKPVIVACFLEPEDYTASSINVFKRGIKTWKIDYDVEELKAKMKEAESLRQEVVKYGVSYYWDPTNQNDMKILELLRCHNESEYNAWLTKEGLLK